MRSYPVFLKLEGKRAVVVGGGRVARRKASALAACGARVKVVSQEVCKSLGRDAARGVLELALRPFAAEDLDGAFLAVAATNVAAVNRQVAAAAGSRGVLINVVDSPEDCGFYVPASFARGRLQVAVGTGGACPAFAAQLSRRLREIVPSACGKRLEKLAAFRARLKAREPSRNKRARMIETLAEASVAELFAARGAGQGAAAPCRFFATGEQPSAGPAGKVWLVGAGPGDAGLITVKGLECVRNAEVLVYDRLCNPQILGHAPETCEFIYVGKRAGQHEVTQRITNHLLASRAAQGKRVCRLKGGDPFVFGRGGEEALFLRARGIPFEVVPGVTSAIAAPAYAGIPVTHRGLASSLRIVAGHEETTHADSATDWEELAAYEGTLVFLMSLGNLANVVSRLIAGGRSPETPAAVISHGTLPTQRTVTAPLAAIACRAIEASLTPPSVLIVGKVAALHEVLDWFPSGAAEPTRTFPAGEPSIAAGPDASAC